MKTLILYYSQTGNTQKIARQIRSGAAVEGSEVYLCHLKHATPKMLEDYDLIGLGSPVWMADPPPVRRFIESLRPQNGKQIFVFCTHGTMPALFFPIVTGNLRKLGFTVIGTADWFGDCCLQTFPSPYYTHGHPDDTDLVQARAFGAEMVRRSRAVSAGDRSCIPAPEKPVVNPFQALAVIDMLLGHKNVHCNLYRDAETCLWPKCHICADHCPMGYIDLASGRFGTDGDACRDCHGCTYCEMLCPTGAIRPDPPYDVDTPAGKVDPDHGLFKKVLQEAVDRGEFRMLLPFDEVGEATPYYSVNPTHPRMKPLSTKEDNNGEEQ